MKKTPIPKYPVYVISKGRAECCLTANFLIKDNVPFKIVIEPQEVDQYAVVYGKERLLLLPFRNLGLGSIPARNWVWEHSKKEGHLRHWILDDNIRDIRRLYKGFRIVCNANFAFTVAEAFVDRYENIAISGLNYQMFVTDECPTPYMLNTRIYSCLLILNELPNRWRGRYNEDTDLSLQVLSDGWCTVLFNAFMIRKMTTMKMKGGNTAELYKGDGRLHMARSLERIWPYIVRVERRFRRPQHVVRDGFRVFDTKLKRRKDVDFSKLKTNEFGMELKQIESTIQSPRLKELYKKSQYSYQGEVRVEQKSKRLGGDVR